MDVDESRSHQAEGMNHEPTSKQLQDDVFWLEDGNIILSVQSKLFKIHKSILSLHSPFFKEMWDLPQPESAPQMDGVPILEMNGVESENWKDFLELLHRGYMISWDIDARNLHLIISRLKLATKYLFDDVRTKTIKILEAHWGTEPNIPPVRKDVFQLYRTGFHPGLLLEVAQECNVPGILPLAYNDLISMPKLLSSDSEDAIQQYWNHPSLTQADLRKAAAASDIIRKRIDGIKSWQAYHHNTNACNMAAGKWLIEYAKPELHRTVDIWATLSEMEKPDAMKGYSICTICMAKGCTAFLSFRNNLWASWHTIWKLCD